MMTTGYIMNRITPSNWDVEMIGIPLALFLSLALALGLPLLFDIIRWVDQSFLYHV